MHHSAAGDLSVERSGPMKSEKKGFVLYFDTLDCLQCLSPDQRGHLFTALYRYAKDAAEADLPPETALDAFPQLCPEARMAFRFMADTVRRDTAKWKRSRERYCLAAQERAREARENRAIKAE